MKIVEFVALTICLFVFALFGFAVGSVSTQLKYERVAIKAGVGEYYINNHNERAFRFKTNGIKEKVESPVLRENK